MNKFFIGLSALMMSGMASSANIIIAFPTGNEGKEIIVNHQLIQDYVKPRTERPAVITDTLKVKNNAVVFETESKGNAVYRIPFDGKEAIDFYTSPGDDLMVKVNYMTPLMYSVEGSELMDGIYQLKPREYELIKKYSDAYEKRDEASMEAIVKEYNALFTDFIKNNPKSPAIGYALQKLDGEEFLSEFKALGASIEGNMLYPILESQRNYIEKSMAAEKKIEDLQSGNVMAPEFTLKDLEGRDVKLSDFRGKWVVLDFWGSWCGWCIKGFPQLKDAYIQYQPELEVIGIDCNETEQAWRKGVAKYELPWVNVYNPSTSGLLSEYGITGFPTKAIISPEGKIAKIVVGEDPAFYDYLARFINGK